MNVVINILFGVMLINMCILTGCFAIQCIEDSLERRAKKKQDAKAQPGGAAK
jgi:hypothetical protein